MRNRKRVPQADLKTFMFTNMAGKKRAANITVSEVKMLNHGDGDLFIIRKKLALRCADLSSSAYSYSSFTILEQQ